MRINLPSSLRTLLLALAAALQVLPSPAEPPSSPPADKELAAAKIEIKSFEFPGGTVQDFAKLLEKPPFPWSTVVVQDNLRSVPMPAFRLKNVSSLDILDIAMFLSDKPFLSAVKDGILQLRSRDLTQEFEASRISPPLKSPSEAKIAPFDFPGGTFEEFAEQLRHPPFQWQMVSVDPNAANQEIPAFRLKLATAKEILKTAGILTNGDFRSVDQGWLLYISSSQLKIAPQTGVFSLRKILETCKFEDVNALISKTLETSQAGSTQPAHKPPNLSFHKETQTLIAVGTPDQIALVAQVLMSLNNSGPTPPAQAQPPTSTP